MIPGSPCSSLQPGKEVGDAMLARLIGSLNPLPVGALEAHELEGDAVVLAPARLDLANFGRDTEVDDPLAVGDMKHDLHLVPLRAGARRDLEDHALADETDE